jgi:hypothetical protein
VRAHVPAVGQQGHGAKQIARGYFDDHHRQGQQDHPAGIAFTVSVYNIKAVAVFPALKRVDVHATAFFSKLHYYHYQSLPFAVNPIGAVFGDSS